MTIELRNTLSEGHFKDLLDLYQHTYWARDRSPEDVRKMLDHTDMVFALVDTETDRLVAFARVLTDTVYKVLIFDVVVHPEHRGNGLARTLLDSILDHPELRGAKHFELYCRDDVVKLYEKWGFRSDLGGQVFLRRDGKKRI